jgi:hypothetical protein
VSPVAHGSDVAVVVVAVVVVAVVVAAVVVVVGAVVVGAVVVGVLLTRAVVCGALEVALLPPLPPFPAVLGAALVWASSV